jgi:hypothetical protein
MVGGVAVIDTEEISGMWFSDQADALVAVSGS